MSVSAWLEEEAAVPFDAAPRAISSRKKPQILGYGRTGRTLIALSVIAVLSLVSYATYAHQWSELSALRHLGQASSHNKSR